jgi:hypothetical protein
MIPARIELVSFDAALFEGYWPKGASSAGTLIQNVLD